MQIAPAHRTKADRMTRTCKLVLQFAALALAGCAHAPRVAVVHCLTPDQLQQLKDAEPPKVSDKLTGNAAEDVKTIAGSAVRLRTWGNGLLGVLGGCTG